MPARALAALAVAFIVATGLLVAAGAREALPAWRTGGLEAGIRTLFRVDASTDSLVLEDDPDARRYDRTRLLFESDEFVLVALTRDDLFTPAGVAAVRGLHERFSRIEGVLDVLSIADVALLRSFKKAPMPMMALAKQARIDDPAVDLELAKAELTEHTLYAGNLISRDARTAGIVVSLVARPESLEASRGWLERLAARHAAQDALAALAKDAPAAARAEAEAAVAAAHAAVLEFRPRYVAIEDERKAERIRIIQQIRAIVAETRAAGATIEVSGVPSIVVEMVEAIQRDLEKFTLLAAVFVVAFLAVVFRRVRWVALPMLATCSTVAWTVGLMLWLGKRVTVITANVPALLLVVALAHSIHMVVRWRELLARFPAATRGERVLWLVRGLWWPCLFTSTTTIVGFVSLVTAGSRPIKDFGLLMAFGTALSFVVSFVVVPGLLYLLPDLKGEGQLERSATFLEGVARASMRRRWRVGLVAAVLAAVGAWGASRLDVEARFIDYFKRGSQVHTGLTTIDQRLGGTSGLEIIVEGPAGSLGPAKPDNLQRLADLEAWLRARPEVGVVMGYAGIIDEMRKLAPKADRRQVGFMLGQALGPEKLQGLIGPYVTVQPREVEKRTVGPYAAARIVARVRETDDGLRRRELLEEVKQELARRFPKETGLTAEPTGMFVLYANMLSTLMGSQVSSSLYCLGAIWLMLTLLLRHPGAAALALVPNLLPILVVLGAMGLGGVPLDMATVMIASVSLGIGIDAAIHYLFRYRFELEKDGKLDEALARTSGSIGTSIFWTSLTSVVGFAVLAVSEFRPNAYFGLLTGVAMVAALFAMLTLLPVLVQLVGLFSGRAVNAHAALAAGVPGGPEAAGAPPPVEAKPADAPPPVEAKPGDAPPPPDAPPPAGPAP